MGILKYFVKECVVSLQLGGIRKFWSISTFRLKKSYKNIQKDFLNYTNPSCTNFNQNVLLIQNVLIPPNCILLNLYFFFVFLVRFG